jgi:acetyl esterase/lipase
MINYHGGGFVLGNRYSNDASLRYLIKKVPRMAVVSVEYTLAPAKKYPTQLQVMNMLAVK